MLGLDMTHITFQAQYLILQTLQRYLEQSAFRLVRKWLLPQFLDVGWTCPEALELHKFFKLVLNIGRKSRLSNVVKILALFRICAIQLLASATPLCFLKGDSLRIISKLTLAHNQD